ncbi:OmpA family protein, partial [Oleiphilus sp. HI0067]
DRSDTNGGSSDALDPGNDGFIINTTAMFNSQYSDYFDTYLDFAWLQYTDRKVIIPGLGIVHSAELEDSAIQPFIGAGVGYAFMYLDDSPSAKLDSIDRNGQSVVFTLQAGADIPLSESLSLDLTARYDMYNIDSSFLQDSGLTIVKDRGALSVLAGLSYHFDSPSRSNYVDEDFDGVTRNLDRCPDTLINVPVNEAGCPQYRFNINLSFNFAKFGIDDIVEHPDFNAAEFLKKNTQYSVRIIGYTDSKGSASFNEKLAKKRAIEAKQYF